MSKWVPCLNAPLDTVAKIFQRLQLFWFITSMFCLLVSVAHCNAAFYGYGIENTYSDKVINRFACKLASLSGFRKDSCLDNDLMLMQKTRGRSRISCETMGVNLISCRVINITTLFAVPIYELLLILSTVYCDFHALLAPLSTSWSVIRYYKRVVSLLSVCAWEQVIIQMSKDWYS